MAVTDDGFVYPEKGDNLLNLWVWFKRLAQSVQAFMDKSVGSRVMHPTGFSAPDASASNVSSDGLITFTNASAIHIDGVFDWDARLNYEVEFQFNAIYADTSFAFRARAGGLDDADAHYGYTRTRAYNDGDGNNVGKTAVYTTTSDGEAVITPPTGSGYYTTAIGSVKLAKVRNSTRLHGFFQALTNFNFNIQTATGAFALDPLVDKFDGFTIFPKTGTQFSGTVRIYGRN